MAAPGTSAAAAATAATRGPLSLAILLYRPHDLRTDDHAALADAATRADLLLPVFCLDEERELCPRPRPRPRPRRRRTAAAAVPPTGPHRLRFRLEALSDLRAALEALGSGLVVRSGAPEEALPLVLRECVEASGAPAAAASVSLVFHRRPPAPPLPDDDDDDNSEGHDDDDDEDAAERRIAEAFARACEELGLGRPTIRRHWGAATLHHPLLEVAAWLGIGVGGAAAEAPTDADAAEELLLPRLPETFSAYKRALEAGAPRISTTAASFEKIEKKNNKSSSSRGNKPPLGALLPSTAPVPAPTEPLPPLPAPFCDDRRAATHGALPSDTYELYARAPGALDALRELSRLCGDEDLRRPGAVVPAYAAAAGGGGSKKAVAEHDHRHPRADPRSAFPYVGGERAALCRLERVLGYVLDARPVGYGEARMMAAGGESARLSPYISAGCLSPRRVAHELRRQEREKKERESGRQGDGGGDGGGDCDDSEEDDADARWLLSHLVIRDWYVLSGWRERVLSRSRRRDRSAGAAGASVDNARPLLPPAFEAWARGESSSSSSGGSALVGAAMRELAATGWQSNRSRQLSASALARDLPPAGDEAGGEWGGWPLGARLFESLLIDGDRSANRGNWRSVSTRRFDLEAQRLKYDPEGLLERAWLSAGRE